MTFFPNIYSYLIKIILVVGFCPVLTLWEYVLWDFVLWDFVLWDSVWIPHPQGQVNKANLAEAYLLNSLVTKLVLFLFLWFLGHIITWINWGLKELSRHNHSQKFECILTWRRFQSASQRFWCGIYYWKKCKFSFIKVKFLFGSFKKYLRSSKVLS